MLVMPNTIFNIPKENLIDSKNILDIENFYRLYTYVVHIYFERAKNKRRKNRNNLFGPPEMFTIN